MRQAAPDGFAATLDAIPEGTSRGQAFGRLYLVTRSLFNGGKSQKLVAEALDGSDYISLNFYSLTAGDQLAPCEMPHDKVVRFAQSYRAD
ncbi:hypothetical protein ABMC89_08465 [Sulfitobacter sp. HNIBRBA3233]|uniref:hypothetical protein n=1 Tax=Sulfitobacter marinivivus TaxID=3158558 RepID=UPI0032DF66ED